MAISVALLITAITVGGQLGTTLQPAEAALMGLTFEELSRQAELIILGVVLDETIAITGSSGPGLVNHTVSVEKVIKGTYPGNTVSVISESEVYEDSPKFGKVRG